MSLPESPRDREKLLQASTETLEKLFSEAQAADSIPCWIRKGHFLPQEASPRARFFHYTGFLKVPNFCSNCQEMKDTMADLVYHNWHPERDGLESFGTTAQENKERGDYFLESSTAVHYFAEPLALDQTKQKLLPQYHSEKLKALNKAGHALHLPSSSQQKNPFFDYCTSPQIRQLVVDELLWQDPVVPQSMYIFKQAHTGGVVTSHQDSTFLYTTPKQSCLGLWLALDDATLDNGCLWVRPKSHHESVRRHFQRNPEYFGRKEKDIPADSTFNADGKTQQFIMKDLYEHEIAWDGAVPEDLLEAGFIPIPCKAGDLLVFNGELDHLSLPNHSDCARHTFQLHLVEGPQAGVTWSHHNWLQYPDGQPFLRLLDFASK